MLWKQDTPLHQDPDALSMRLGETDNQDKIRDCKNAAAYELPPPVFSPGFGLFQPVYPLRQSVI
jgi:hypothetical protein